MPDLPDLRTGIYRHYKGPLYQVLGYSHNASSDDRPQVLYIGLELDAAKEGPRFATRDVDDFLMLHLHVDPDGSVAECEGNCRRGGRHVARFQYLGPVYVAGMETR